MHEECSNPGESAGSEPPVHEQEDVTALLERVVHGDAVAEEHLYAKIYGELHKLAARHMRRERPEHTLDPTDLVNEFFLRVRRSVGDRWPNRRAFYGMASKAMKNILVDHARRRLADRRARDRQVPMSTTLLAGYGALGDASLLRLEEHLVVLRERDPRAEEIVRLHLFSGLTTDTIAPLLDLHLRTVQRDLRKALGFLEGALGNA